MCDPVSIFAAAAITSAAGTYMAVDGQKKAANFQAAVADQNAKLSGQAAADAVQRGNVAAQERSRQTQQMLGTQRATLAARGIDISTGSPLSILEDTSYFGQVDENTIRSNAEREAWGFKVQGVSHKANASGLRAQADGMNPLFSAGTSLLGSAATYVAPRWYGNRTTPEG